MSGVLIYITGLSGSGKTTIGKALQERIPHSIILDGDQIRSAMNSDLGYTAEAKVENIRRNNELIKLLYDQGVTVIACFMASVAVERDKVFDMCPMSVKVQLTTSVDICRARDTKGLYTRVVDNFAGVSAPYQSLSNPDIMIDTSLESIDTSVRMILINYEEIIKNQ